MKEYTTLQPEEPTQENLAELQQEDAKLRKKISRLGLARTLAVALSLIGVGGVSLAASYLVESIILTLAGLGLVFWGVILLYISPQKFVPEKLLGAMGISMTKSIDKLLSSMNYGGKTIFLYPKHLKGLKQGYVFIPYENKDQNPLPSDEALAEEKLVYENPRGLFMVAPSHGLVELIEQEGETNLTSADMQYLKETLPKLLVNNLRVVDGMSMDDSRGFVRVRMEGETAARVCATLSKETSAGKHLGCPLCASVALMISKVSGKPVSIEETRVNEADHSIATTFRMLEV